MYVVRAKIDYEDKSRFFYYKDDAVAYMVELREKYDVDEWDILKLYKCEEIFTQYAN